MRIHLLTPSLIPGDAVSNDVLGMCRWFRRRGLAAYAYAGHCHAELGKKVRPLRTYRRHLNSQDDILLYHHSVGWLAGMDLYRRSQNRRMIRYHNVTPPAFYRPYNAGYVRACRRGIQETRRLARSKPELILADSEFNAQHMIACGADPKVCRTVPPLHRIGALDRLPLDKQLTARLRDRTNLLFVGRVTPNKGQLHLIRALAYYRRYLGGDADLHLVGGFDVGIPGYREQLLAEIRRHGLQEFVHLTGKVTARQLKTYYASAAIFLCASEHEGFGVPLVEAMYYGVPIVAYGGSAVGETVGDAGLTWETPEPGLLAESIYEIDSRPGLREALVQRQRERYRLHFSLEASERRLTEVLGARLAYATCLPPAGIY
jgi:glycosyltransferase involved in cell wall biosynthesis